MVPRKRPKLGSWMRLQSALPGVIKLQGRGRTRGFRYTEKGSFPRVLRGVKPLIKKLFYPKYSYAKARFGPTPPPVKGRTAHTRYGALAKGTRLDTQITNYAVKVAAVIRKGGNVVARAELLKYKQSMSKDALRLVSFLEKMKWTPVRSQICVANPALRIGTAIDLLCVDENNKLLLLELKCGFDRTLLRHTGNKMTRLYTDKFDCPFNQHHIQLGMTKLLWETTYPNHKLEGAYVVIVKASSVVYHELQPWVLSKQNKSPLVRLLSASDRVKGSLSKYATKKKKKKTRKRSIKNKKDVVKSKLQKKTDLARNHVIVRR